MCDHTGNLSCPRVTTRVDVPSCRHGVTALYSMEVATYFTDLYCNLLTVQSCSVVQYPDRWCAHTTSERTDRRPSLFSSVRCPPLPRRAAGLMPVHCVRIRLSAAANSPNGLHLAGASDSVSCCVPGKQSTHQSIFEVHLCTFPRQLDLVNGMRSRSFRHGSCPPSIILHANRTVRLQLLFCPALFSTLCGATHYTHDTPTACGRHL